MKKLFFVLATTICLYSCAPMKHTTLKGNYPTIPYIFETEKTKDQVWDNIIDLFAQNGIPIATIDRSSGLIVSAELKDLTVAYEKKDGTLSNPKAYTVGPQWNNGGSFIKPKFAVGTWNVRVKEVNGKTSVNVNLLKIRCYYVNSYNPVSNTPVAYPPTDGKSTQKFEQIIAESLTKM